MRRGEAYDRRVMRADVASEVRRELTGLSHRGLDWVEFSEQGSNLIRRVVPHGRACWHPTDPGTLLVTGSYLENLFGQGLPPLTWCEYAVEDFNKWSFLARSPWPVGILSRATHGQPEHNPRFGVEAGSVERADAEAV
jgi:hypothetical protein